MTHFAFTFSPCSPLQLELRLAEKEEGLLERELILEQDCRLCERSQKRVDAGKDDTLQLAKKVREASGMKWGDTPNF